MLLKHPGCILWVLNQSQGPGPGNRTTPIRRGSRRGRWSCSYILER